MFAINLSRTYTHIIYLMCSLSIVLLSFFVNYYGLKGAFISMITVELIIISLYSINIIKKIKA